MMQNQGGGFNTSGFGAQNVSKPTTINTFGQSSTQNKPTLSLTGNNSGSAFGASTQQGGSLFGGTSTSTQQSGNLFGSASSNTQQGGSLFGNTSATAQQGSNLFGSASNTTQQNSGLFGNTSTTSQQGAGLFGNTSVTNQTVNNLGGFGQKNGLSINTATTQAGAFGSSLSQPNTALFPNNTLNAKSTAIATQGFNFNLQKSGTGFGTITQPSTSFNTNLQQSQGQFNPNAKQYLTGGEGAIQLNATNLLNPNRQEDANGFVINSGLFDENSKEIPARLVTGGSKPVIILPVKDQDGNYNTEKGPFLFKRPNTGLENYRSEFTNNTVTTLNQTSSINQAPPQHQSVPFGDIRVDVSKDKEIAESKEKEKQKEKEEEKEKQKDIHIKDASLRSFLTYIDPFKDHGTKMANDRMYVDPRSLDPTFDMTKLLFFNGNKEVKREVAQKYSRVTPEQSEDYDILITPDIQCMTENELKSVNNLRITIRNTIDIDFYMPVDLSEYHGMDLESKLLQLVNVHRLDFKLYPDHVRPEFGKGINVPCKVTVQSSWNYYKFIHNLSNAKYDDCLKFVEGVLKQKEDCHFIKYDFDRDQWIFMYATGDYYKGIKTADYYKI